MYKYITTALIFIAGAIILAALQPSDADIRACVENSNYTAERCMFEMSK